MSRRPAATDARAVQDGQDEQIDPAEAEEREGPPRDGSGDRPASGTMDPAEAEEREGARGTIRAFLVRNLNPKP